MQVAHIVSRNIQALIDGTEEMNENALSVSSGVPKTTVRRMRLGEGMPQIDNVERVALAFKLRACDLLDPDLARRVEAGEARRMTQAKPPVITEEDWRRLSPRTRALVEDVCTHALSGQLQDSAIAWLHDGVQQFLPRG